MPPGAASVERALPGRAGWGPQPYGTQLSLTKRPPASSLPTQTLVAHSPVWPHPKGPGDRPVTVHSRWARWRPGHGRVVLAQLSLPRPALMLSCSQQSLDHLDEPMGSGDGDVPSRSAERWPAAEEGPAGAWARRGGEDGVLLGPPGLAAVWSLLTWALPSQSGMESGAMVPCGRCDPQVSCPAQDGPGPWAPADLPWLKGRPARQKASAHGLAPRGARAGQEQASHTAPHGSPFHFQLRDKAIRAQRGPRPHGGRPGSEEKGAASSRFRVPGRGRPGQGLHPGEGPGDTLGDRSCWGRAPAPSACRLEPGSGPAVLPAPYAAHPR